jgi:hypothetical protein
LISLAASPAALCLTRIIRVEEFTYLLQHTQQVIGLLRQLCRSSTSSCYPQNVTLNENAGFQSEIIAVVHSIG